MIQRLQSVRLCTCVHVYARNHLKPLCNRFPIQPKHCYGNDCCKHLHSNTHAHDATIKQGAFWIHSWMSWASIEAFLDKRQRPKSCHLTTLLHTLEGTKVAGKHGSAGTSSYKVPWHQEIILQNKTEENLLIVTVAYSLLPIILHYAYWSCSLPSSLIALSNQLMWTETMPCLTFSRLWQAKVYCKVFVILSS